jgi:hypothetical protein
LSRHEHFPSIRHLSRMSIVGLVTAILAGCSGTVPGSGLPDAATYAAPVSNLTICSGYGCIIKDKLAFAEQIRVDLEQIMEPGRESAEAERTALKSAIAYMEAAARDTLRYKPDIEFSYQKNRHKRGQMDCVDESLNTISFLKYLQSHGLLRFHKPLPHYANRGLLVDGRYPHKSARMRDNQGNDWAVDSWKRPNGGEPEIMTLAKWYRGRNDATNY